MCFKEHGEPAAIYQSFVLSRAKRNIWRMAMVIGKSKSNDKLYTKTPELKLDLKKIELHANQRGTLRMVLKSVRDEKDIETNVYRNLFSIETNK